MRFYHLPVWGSLQLTPRVGANVFFSAIHMSHPRFNSRPRGSNTVFCQCALELLTLTHATLGGEREESVA